jgi:hypothetical protein
MRLPTYDYSQPGGYFITVCTQDRECLLGDIVDGEVQLNPMGMLVQETWRQLPQRFPSIALDAFVIMPNHVHGILHIVGAQFIAPNVAGNPSGPSHNDRTGRDESRPYTVGSGNQTQLKTPGAVDRAPTVGDVVPANIDQSYKS